MDIVRYIGLAACIAVLLGCICRIGLMQRRRNHVSWWLIYVLLAVYAAGMALDLAIGRWVDWYEIAGIGGVLLYLERTRKLWRHGPPPETCTDHAPLEDR